MSGAHVNEFSSHAEEPFHDVGLARPASQRFVMKNELLVYRIASPRRSRHKEPLTLPAKGRIFAAVSQPGWNSEQVLPRANCAGLQCFLGLHDAGGSAGNSGDKPLPFVVSTEKACCFSLGRTDEQEQMAVAFVGLEHVDVERLAQRLGNAEFEEFTAAILLDKTSMD